MTICMRQPSLPALHWWKDNGNCFLGIAKLGPQSWTQAPAATNRMGPHNTTKWRRNLRVCYQQKTSWLQSFGMRNLLFLWTSCLVENTEIGVLYWSTSKSECLPLPSLSCSSMTTHHASTDVMDDAAAPSLQSWPCTCLVLWKRECMDSFTRMIRYCRITPCASGCKVSRGTPLHAFVGRWKNTWRRWALNCKTTVLSAKF